jgi:hypothetical protein
MSTEIIIFGIILAVLVALRVFFSKDKKKEPED